VKLFGMSFLKLVAGKHVYQEKSSSFNSQEGEVHCQSELGRGIVAIIAHDCVSKRSFWLWGT